MIETGQETLAIEAVGADIARWLEEHRTAAQADRFVLGLSGGVDSAVVCGLCVRAAGADRVTGVIMPSNSNPDDARYAAEVASTFGVETVTVDLSSTTEGLVNAIETGLRQSRGGDGATERQQQLALANVRPRLRMTTLYYIANLRNGIVAGTGNKSEAMIGYYTKYGDGGVDLLPLIDLYKHEVRALARSLGVPAAIIEKPPSAGLWPGQTDEAEIGLSYDELDAALAAIEAGREDSLEPAVRDRITGLIDISGHKRAPVPAYRRRERQVGLGQ
jgi:NAD+ synthase